MKSRIVTISFAAQRSRATERYEIVPGSKGETRTLHATRHPTGDTLKESMGPIMIIEVKRDEKMESSHDLLHTPDIVSIIESYEPLTAFSPLTIWRRNTIYHDEIIFILGDVSHDCKTFKHILNIFKYCTSIWINTGRETVPIDPICSDWFTEPVFCKVAAYGSYESYTSLGEIVFSGQSFPRSTGGEGWRREVLNERMEIKDETLPIPVALAVVIPNVDADTFARIYPLGTHMEQCVFINIMAATIGSDSPHLYHLVDFYKGIPQSTVQSYMESKVSEEDMKKCVFIWKESKTKGDSISSAITEICDYLCLSLSRFARWKTYSGFSGKFAPRSKEILRSHTCSILRSRSKKPKEIVRGIRDIVITAFYECSRDDANCNISLLIVRMLRRLHISQHPHCENLARLIGHGFIMEDHISRIVHLERSEEIIALAHDIYGPSVLGSILPALCERIGSLVSDAKQRDTETCYLISHLRHAFNLATQSVRTDTADRVHLAIVKYMLVYKNHQCEHNKSLDSFLEGVMSYVPTGEEEVNEVEE